MWPHQLPAQVPLHSKHPPASLLLVLTRLYMLSPFILGHLPTLLPLPRPSLPSPLPLSSHQDSYPTSWAEPTWPPIFSPQRYLNFPFSGSAGIWSVSAKATTVPVFRTAPHTAWAWHPTLHGPGMEWARKDQSDGHSQECFSFFLLPP